LDEPNTLRSVALIMPEILSGAAAPMSCPS